MKRLVVGWQASVALLVVIVALIVALVVISLTDEDAVERCEKLGGQTWDSGQHCAIGDYKVVDTR